MTKHRAQCAPSSHRTSVETLAIRVVIRGSYVVRSSFARRLLAASRDVT
ncbi:hypothetical protein BURMUCF2_1420 [Burkholderia multivorans CF2]|nr:hypothetical protein BURMUCF2_1420 [Burkholderia multivorans CF2]